MKVSTTLAGGGLAARFGDAFTDQSNDASFVCPAEAEPAASAPKGAAKQQHVARKAIAAFRCVRLDSPFNLVLEDRP
jgi:hypothetical protein